MLFLISSAEAAVIYGGKLFHSENFTTSIGGSFKVYGTDSFKAYNNVTGLYQTYYGNAIVMSNIDSTVMISNGTCQNTKIYKYCYKGSSVDFDDERTYDNGDILPVMTITIESLPPPTTVVTFTRSNIIKAYCGELITVPISIKNSGGLPTNITYAEILPVNTMITTTVGGKVEGNVVTFKEKLMENTSKNYSYTIINFDCASKNWYARYSFTTHNDTIWKNITNLNLTMLDSYRINESVYPLRMNYLSDDIMYNFTINNTHPSISLFLDINIAAPDLVARDVSNGISNINTSYRYSGMLYMGRSLTLSIVFNPLKYGRFAITNNATIKINDRKMNYDSTNEVYVAYRNVTTFIDVNDTINNSLSVSVYAVNDDLGEKYYYIYGVLKGIGDDEPIYANNIEPGAKILVGNKRYNTTGMGVKDINFVFSGIYRDKNSIEHPLYAEKIVKINSPHSNANVISVQPDSTKTTNSSKPVSTPNVVKKSSTSKNTTVSGDSSGEEKKDIITRIIEGLSRFLESIFS
jgi:hypothetical protein